MEGKRPKGLAPLAQVAHRGRTARARLIGALLLVGAALIASAITPAITHAADRGACADHDPARNAYFGDLHVHTIFSLDASTQDTRTRPSDAYRFAKGERLGIQPFRADGSALRHIQISRPLDFAAVTDHSELIGEWNTCNSEDLPGYDSWVCMLYRNWPRGAFLWMNYQASQARRHDFCGEDGKICREAARAPWHETLEAAEAHQDRSPACRFTTFPAYEWTGGVGGTGNNFHRNVIFKNEHVPELPISFIDEPGLEDFRRRLSEECRDAGTGCDVVVIPHNSNLSGGLMFSTTRTDGTPLTRADAIDRSSYETLVEIMQHKGDSECHPEFSSEDELCGFEKLAMSNFGARFLPGDPDPPVARQFVRRVLLEGMELDRRLGANPFQLGIIASTDTHLGAPGLADESADYPGHGGAGTPVGDELPKGLPDEYDFNPGGLAVLWAEENSRNSLFEAMRRREAYGTSGPRIVVRFFGAFELPPDLCDSGDLVDTGYQSGVPMGGTLARPAADAQGPAFVVSALRDPGTETSPGTPLQRIEIIKGWLDGPELREQVFAVAGNAENGARVDTKTCQTSGPGSVSLCSVWRDPNFDPQQHAFYYARVAENPTCRWSQKLCNARRVSCDDPASVTTGLEACCSADHQPVIQERAWTSPIWYRPKPPANSPKTPAAAASEAQAP
jgi:hypothetical protein